MIVRRHLETKKKKLLPTEGYFLREIGGNPGQGELELNERYVYPQVVIRGRNNYTTRIFACSVTAYGNLLSEQTGLLLCLGQQRGTERRNLACIALGGRAAIYDGMHQSMRMERVEGHIAIYPSLTYSKV